MILKNIKITNFHCFRNDIFCFSKKTTVLIGKNGRGKSSLVKAIKNALSVFFSNNTRWGYPSLAGTVPDLGVANMNIREVWHDDKMKYADFVDLKVCAEYCGSNLPDWSFHKRAREKANSQSSYYKEAYVEFYKRYQTYNILPIFAYYSDSFPHIDTNLSSNIKAMIDNDDILDRSWGYYHWDYDTSCAIIWQLRFMRIFRLYSSYIKILEDTEGTSNALKESLSKKIDKYSAEINYIKNQLKRFAANDNPNLSGKPEDLQIADLFVDGINTPYIVLLMSDGSCRRWDELPAGYARLFNIVLDLAYRSYVLNGPNAKVQGVVFIDELDLHLHPSMEQDVLYRFRNAFPDLQFIVTTHSPLVIGNFQQDVDNTIIQMEYSNGKFDHHFVENIFGMDYDVTLSSIMATEPRNERIQMLKDKYVRLMLRSKNDKALEVLEQLRMMVSNDYYAQIVSELSKIISNNKHYEIHQ